jgi:NitT/TauT family transport system permease protein
VSAGKALKRSPRTRLVTLGHLAGKNWRASRMMMFTEAVLAGALPMVFTGLKLGMGVALIIIVIAEIIGAKSGIGFLIWNSWQVFQVEKMYVGLMVSALLGFGSAALLDVVERRLHPLEELRMQK